MLRLDRVTSHARHPLVLVMVLIGIPLLIVHGATGTPNGYSAYYNLAWADGFDKAFWAGELYPRRLETLLDGSGGLDFFFYGPLPFHLNATLGRALCGGCSATEAFPLTGAILLLLSGPAFYVLARRFTLPLAAAVGAGVYMLLPYHVLADWWVRQAVGEVAAFIFAPLVILGMKQILDGKGGRCLFSLSLAGLVLSHLPSTMILAYLLAPYGLWRLWTARAEPAQCLQRALTLGMAGVLGLSLSAIYWLPAILLLADVSPSLLYTPYADPLNWLFLDGRTAPNPTTEMWTGALLAAAVAIAALYYATSRNQPPAQCTPLTAWVLGLVGFGVIMTTVVSAPLWAFTPIAAVQFPWRTLMVVDLGLALAASGLAAQAFAWQPGMTPDPRRTIGAGAAASLAMLAIASSLMAPNLRTAVETAHRTPEAPMATGALEYIPAPLLERVRMEVAALPAAEPGDNPYERWYQGIARAVATMRDASEASGVSAQSVTTRHIAVNVDARAGDKVVLPIAYWSHWTAVDGASGEPLALSQHPETGAIALAVPAGTTQVDLILPHTMPERVGAGVSLAAVLVLLILALGRRVGRGASRFRPANAASS